MQSSTPPGNRIQKLLHCQLKKIEMRKNRKVLDNNSVQGTAINFTPSCYYRSHGGEREGERGEGSAVSSLKVSQWRGGEGRGDGGVRIRANPFILDHMQQLPRQKERRMKTS